MNKKINRTKKKGFTLIELLVVLGIIGVLALAVAPTMVSKVDEAKEKTDVSNANAIAMAVKTEIIEGDINASGPIEESDITEIGNKYFDGKFPTSQSLKTNFTVELTNNVITVKVGEKEFYPSYVEEDKKDDTETAGN